MEKRIKRTVIVEIIAADNDGTRTRNVEVTDFPSEDEIMQIGRDVIGDPNAAFHRIVHRTKQDGSGAEVDVLLTEHGAFNPRATATLRRGKIFGTALVFSERLLPLMYDESDGRDEGG